MTSVVIFGTGGHAKVVYDILLKQKKYAVAGFVTNDVEKQSFLGLTCFKQSELANLPVNAGVVAIGDNFTRQQLFITIKKAQPNFEFIAAVHPSAQIGQGVKIGAGTVVMANVCVNSDSVVGEHVILNTSCSVDHDCHLAEFSSLAPGVVLGGNVQVGSLTAISIGAVIKHGITIGAQSVVGAGALVLEDIGNHKVAFGNPCKIIRERKAGEKYL